MLDELKLFIVTAEEGSLTAAAERMGTTVATVSRRISALEQHLGCRLLHRSPRGLALTQEGEAYFRECAEFVHLLDQRLDSLNDALNSLSGPLKVLAPTNLAVGPLDEFWQQFVRQYPQVELSVELNNGLVDLKHAQADLAIRIGPQPDSTLIQKNLGYFRTVLVARPSLWNGCTPPQTVDDLQACTTVAAKALSHWELASGERKATTLKKRHKYVVNDLDMATNLVKAGAGIALLPLSAVHKHLKSGELVRVLPEWQGQYRHLHLVWPYRRALSVRARAFSVMLDEFLQEQGWFEQVGSRQAD